MHSRVFDHLIGNGAAKSYLEKTYAEGRIPHAFLFLGLNGVGKMQFAKALAAQLLGADLARISSENHPDLHVLRPEGKSGLFAVDALRTLIDASHSAPFEGKARVFILEDAERMQPAGANTLLKTLEEPQEDTFFILLSSAPQEILPTIRSRCSELAFQPIAEEEIASVLEARGLPRLLAKRAHGSLGKALEMAANSGFEALRKNLFALLAQNTNPLEWMRELEKVDAFLDEEKEENPVGRSRKADDLLAALLMWARDQHLQRLGGDSRLLFFPEEPLAPYPIAPLPKIEKAAAEARLAFQRNMKFSLCLDSMIHKFTRD